MGDLYLHAAGTLLGSSPSVEWLGTPSGFATTGIVKNDVGDYTVALSWPVDEGKAFVSCIDHQVGEPHANEVFAYSRPDASHVRIGVRNLADEPVDIDFDVIVVAIRAPGP